MLPPESLARPIGDPCAAMIAASPALVIPGVRSKKSGLLVEGGTAPETVEFE
jgi:hypothetical protein